MRDAVFAAVSGILYFRFGKVTELGLWGPLRWGFIEWVAVGSELPLNLYCKIAEFFLTAKTAVIPNPSDIYFCYYLKDGVCCRYSLDYEVVQMSAHSRIWCGCSFGAPVPSACDLVFFVFFWHVWCLRAWELYNIYVCVYVCVYVCIYIYIYMYVYVYMYIYLYLYIYIFLYLSFLFFFCLACWILSICGGVLQCRLLKILFYFRVLGIKSVNFV